jgi:signal transduction histidine kinase
MRQLVRRTALLGAATGAGTAIVVGGLAAAVLLGEEHRRAQSPTADPVPDWWFAVAVALTLAVTGGVTLLAASALANRTSATLTQAMSRLTQRADDFGAGGFSLDPVGVDPPLRHGEDDWQTGVEEVDTVGRILERNHRSLARALSAERSFAADASHQLRTPLAALLMRLEEIVHTDDLAAAKVEAEVAIGQTERLAGVVDDLLHRTRAGHADGGRSVSLDTVLSGLEQEWTPAFEAAGRSIVVSAERAMIVRSSASAISQILNTLVENALQHGAGQLTVSAVRSGPSAMIEVRDEGEGIELDLARRIFDRAVTSGRGTGLGLAVARETAESFGGRLELAQPSPAVFVLYVSMAPAP